MITLSADTATGSARPGWMPGSIVPGPMGVGPHHRVPLAPAAMLLEPAPVLRSQMPDGAAAYAAAPAAPRPLPAAAVPAEAEADLATVDTPTERVGRGLLRAALAIPVGMAVAGAIWKVGFIAGLSGLVLAVGATSLYAAGAGVKARRGAPALVGLIALGVVLSFVTCLVLDLNTLYSAVVTPGGPSRPTFIGQMLSSPAFLGAYGRDAVEFAGLGLLGVSRVLVGLLRPGRAG